MIIDYQSNSFQISLGFDSNDIELRNYIKIEQRSKFTRTKQYIMWEPLLKSWIINESGYRLVLDLLHYTRTKQLMGTVTNAALSKINYLESFEARAEWKNEDKKYFDSIPNFNTQLRLYQQTGIKFLDDAGGRGIIGLGTGTGKSALALGWCCLNNKKTIIVCPSSKGRTKRSWADQIKEHTTKNAFILRGGTKIDLLSFSRPDFIILNYELVTKFKGVLLNLVKFFDYKCVIVDESHFIKGAKTQRTHAVQELAGACENRILLSATAIKNNPKELFTQLNLVAPDRWNDYNKYKKLYMGGVKKIGFRYIPTKQTKAQQELLHQDIQGIFFSRDKYQILHELPALTIDKILLELPDNSEYYKIDHDVKVGNTTSMVGKQKQHQLLSHDMVDNTVEYVAEKLITDKYNKKVIVYSGFVAVVDAIKDKLGDIAVKIHGNLSQQEAEVNFMKFRTDDKVRVIVATYQSMSESLNLQSFANVVVYNDTPYTPADILQGMGRVERMGQDKKCFCYLLGFENTYYEEVFEMVEEKYKTVCRVFEGKERDEEFLSRVTKE